MKPNYFGESDESQQYADITPMCDYQQETQSHIKSVMMSNEVSQAVS